MSNFLVTNGVTTFSKPPEGYVVDFDHPQQQKALEHYLLFGIGGTFAFVALLQRLYTKLYLHTGLQIDDRKFPSSSFPSSSPLFISFLLSFGLQTLEFLCKLTRSCIISTHAFSLGE